MNEREREKVLEKTMQLSRDDQKSHLTYLSKSSLATRLSLFEKQREIFHSLSQKNKGIIGASDMTYCALILAIGTSRALEKKLTKKSFGELSLDEIRGLSASRAISFKQSLTKVSPKHEKLMGYWAIVRALRLEHEYSYERISLYLKKKHRFSIAPSTIMKKWKLIEIQNIQENEA